MSKIGMKPIDTAGVKIVVEGNSLIKGEGSGKSFSHQMPGFLVGNLIQDGSFLKISVDESKLDMKMRKANVLWGLHRALVANKIIGLGKGFESKVKITGLGYKAIKKGSGLLFKLGYSHEIELDVFDEVSIDIDKTGQNLILKSDNKEKLGLMCARIRALRVPEPYKQTGITVNGERVIAKAGKTSKA